MSISSKDNSFRFLASNLSWLAFFKILTKIVGFIGTIYLARVLDKEGFGLYSYALAILPFFQAFITEGFRVAGTQITSSLDFIKQKAELFCISAKILFVRLAFSLFAYCILYLILMFISPSAMQKSFLSVLFLLLFFYALNTRWILQGLERMKIIGVAVFLGKVVFLSAVLLGVKSSTDLMKLPLLSIASEAIIVFIILFYTLPLFKDAYSTKLTDLLPDGKFLRSFLKQALPISLSFFIIKTTTNLGIIILDLLANHQEVAIYSTAYRLTGSVNEFRTLIIFSVLPIFVKAWIDNKNQIKTILRISTVFNCLFFIPFAVSVFFFSDQIITLLYSSKYDQSIPILSLLIIDAIILWLNLLFPTLLNAARYESVYFKGHIVIMFLGIISFFVFIPVFGAKGIVYSRIICDIFSLCFFALFVHKKMLIDLKEVFFRPLLFIIPVTALILVLLMFVKNTPAGIYLYVLTIILYYVFLSAFKVIKKGEAKSLFLFFKDMLQVK
jgi:PST family polysaccharide transporter